MLEGGFILSAEKTKEQLISDEMSEKIVETAENIVRLNGVNALNVRRILEAMEITNRVFYNRFHNVGDVLEAVYRKTSLKIRQSLAVGIDSGKDFFEQVTDLVCNTLIMSYDFKMQFNHYVFENDSLSKGNYEWWMSEIRKLIDYAHCHNYIKKVDPDMLGYSVWCFCRGFNADAVGRNLPREVALERFRYGFGFLLDGLKP